MFKFKSPAAELAPYINFFSISRYRTGAILRALEKNKKDQVKSIIQKLHPADIAHFITVIPQERRKQLTECIRDEFNPEILVELTPDIKEEIIGYLGTKESAEAIQELETDEAVDVIEDLETHKQEAILKAIPQKQRKEVEEGLSYIEESAGRLSDKNYIAIPAVWSVGKAIQSLRKKKKLPEKFTHIFILNENEEPIGMVALWQLFQATGKQNLLDIANTDIRRISVHTDQEEVAFIFKQYDLTTAPVIDDEGKMVGVITVDDIVDVVEEEAQEDILRLGGVSEPDVHTGYPETIRRRFPWLFVNLLTAVLASLVIGLFEGSIEKLASLAVLMPIIASMGGNAGTQTLTVAVRALATKELNPANKYRVIGKEIMVGMLNGVLFAIIAVIVAYAWYGDIDLGIILALAMVATLLLAGLAGAVIPLILEKMGVDPAIASGVFVTAVTDVVGFGSFLGIATWILI